MQVQMRIHRYWQHAGAELPLNIGEVYDLPDVVAVAFVATGAAVRVDAPSLPYVSPEIAAHVTAPERKTRARRSA